MVDGRLRDQIPAPSGRRPVVLLLALAVLQLPLRFLRNAREGGDCIEMPCLDKVCERGCGCVPLLRQSIYLHTLEQFL